MSGYKKLKIAVYTICKDESQFVSRFMESVKHEADMVIVTDTGSSDNTVELLLSEGAIVHKCIVKPWRFDIPRNVSLSFVPDDVDVCVCIDLDEVLSPGWRAAIERVWKKDETTRLRYPYAWSTNEDGSPAVSFYYDKIHDRKNYRWVLPVHEVATYSSPTGHEIFAQTDEFRLTHKPDPSKSRSSYLPLLEMAAKEKPDDDRTSHYLGREYLFYGMYDKSIAELTRHLSLPSAKWNSERCASMRYIGRSLFAQGKLKEAEKQFLVACAEASDEREPWYELTRNYYFQQNWPGVYYAGKMALSIEVRTYGYISLPECWNGDIEDFTSIGAWNIGLKSEALELANKALSFKPNDTRIQNNVKLMSSDTSWKNLGI